METLRKTFATSQPGKGLYTLFILALNAVRLPLWILYYIPTSTRPHSSYSHKQAVRVRIVRAFLDYASFVEMRTPPSLKPGAEGDRFIVHPAAPSKYFKGSTLVDPKIKPEQVGGTWYPAEPKGSTKPDWVVLHFHGGAYAIGDGRTHDAGFAAKTLITNTDITHVFAPQYRLASNPGGRFPSQLQDAVSSYVYLLETKGVDASRIILSGDSAGANLVLALLKYLADNGKATDLPLPSMGWLWSPWVSPLAASQGYNAERDNSNYWKDYVTVEFGVWGATALAPAKETGLSVASPELTFLDHPFATPVPLFMSFGECESLLPDQKAFADQMSAVKGNTVEIQLEAGCPHDTILAGKMLGFEKEAARNVKGANVFLKQHASTATATQKSTTKL